MSNHLQEHATQALLTSTEYHSVEKHVSSQIMTIFKGKNFEMVAVEL